MIAPEEYGAALYTLAKSEGENGPVNYLQTLRAIDSLFREQPEYGKLLDSPAIMTEKRLRLIDDACGTCEQNILNFIKILCEKHALYQLHACVTAFVKRYNEEHSVTEATCVTAREMTQAQHEALYRRLCDITGGEVQLTVKVDPALIGGIVLLVNGRQLDGSVKTRLDTFRSRLAETIV